MTKPEPIKTNTTRQAKQSARKFKLPGQFKPDRAISDGPWSAYVTNALARQSSLTIDDLTPTQKDIELISNLAFTRDDLADNLATLIFENRQLAHQLEKGLAEGIASLENPPQALVDFLDYYENMPDWTYMKELQKRMETVEGKKFLNAERAPAQKNAFMKALEEGARLTAGFFVGAYYPAVGQSIVITGSVAKGSNRVIQTFKFFDDTSDVRDFMPFGKAIQAGAKVRLGHAFARKQIERTGKWDKDYYGEIISNFDNMLFASGIILGVNATQSGYFKKYGVDPGKAMTYFLGAPEELLQLDQEEIYRFFLMCVSHLDGSPDTAKQVYQSFRSNEHYKAEKSLEEKFYKELTYFFANLMTRIIWGNRIAAEIGMEKYFYGLPLEPLADYLTEKVNARPSESARVIINRTRKLIPPVKKIAKTGIPGILLREKSGKRNQALEPEPYSGSFGIFGGKNKQKKRDIHF